MRKGRTRLVAGAFEEQTNEQRVRDMRISEESLAGTDDFFLDVGSRSR